jgi:hypothetical protein
VCVCACHSYQSIADGTTSITDTTTTNAKARTTHEIMMENALDEQKRRLNADHHAELRAALEKLETNLGNRHKDEMSDMRAQLEKKHKDTVSAADNPLVTLASARTHKQRLPTHSHPPERISRD